MSIFAVAEIIKKRIYIGYIQYIYTHIKEFIYSYFSVLMYVDAPKTQEPKFVVYEYICNQNEGPRPAAFYQILLPEW